MHELHLPWLALTVLTPLLGAIFISRIRNWEIAQKVCVAVCGLTLAWSVGAYIDFTLLQSFEAYDKWNLAEGVISSDAIVIDALSAPLLPLAALLYLITVGSTLRTKMSRIYFTWTLLAESVLLATFCCRNPWWLIACLVLATIPPWFELRVRRRSTRVYVAHMGLFVVLLVSGQFLVDSSDSSSTLFLLGVALLTAGALLRNGVSPLHCWMTDLFDKATLGTALLFVTPMTGVYAVMRLVLPVSPDWALRAIALISLATAVYAAGMAFVQREARRCFCFLFLSLSSLILVGLELVTPMGLTGALCVWLSVELSLTGFGLTLRAVEGRVGRISLNHYHGLYESTPTLAALFLVTGLASIGFPGTVGFVGTELLIEGSVSTNPLVGMVVVTAAALNSIAVLFVYFRVFTGTRHQASISLQSRLPERIAVISVIVIILCGGIHPQPGVASRHRAAAELMRIRAQNAPPPQHARFVSLPEVSAQ